MKGGLLTLPLMSMRRYHAHDAPFCLPRQRQRYATLTPPGAMPSACQVDKTPRAGQDLGVVLDPLFAVCQGVAYLCSTRHQSVCVHIMRPREGVEVELIKLLCVIRDQPQPGLLDILQARQEGPPALRLTRTGTQNGAW